MSSTLYTDHPAFRVWDSTEYSGQGPITTYWLDYLRVDPDLRGLIVCIDVVFGVDKRVFISSRACSTTSSSTGKSYNYLPVMGDEPSISTKVDLGDSSSSARSFSFLLPNELVDASSIIGNGRLLAGVAEVSLQYDGGDYDNRIVMMRGEMDDGVTFSNEGGGTVEFSITDPKESMDLSLPPYVIDEKKFPSAPKESIGFRFPIVLNKYEYVPCVWTVGATGTQRLMACLGNAVIDTGGSDQIYVDGVGYGTSDITYGWSVFSSDSDGVPYIGVELTNNPSTDYTESVYVKVRGGDSTSNPVSQALYLVENYTAFSKASINYHAFTRSISRCASMAATTLVNSGSSNDAGTLSFIETGLLANFPMVSMAWMIGGYGPVVIDRNGPKSGFTLNAQAYPVMHRSTAIAEQAKNKCYNSFTVEYKFNAMEDVYEGVAVADHTNNPICQISTQNIGMRQHETIQCPYINDDNTAGIVLDWLVSHLALPSYYVEYECIASALFSVSLGDNIKLTDSDFSWEEMAATVVSITYKTGLVVLGIRVWSPYYSKLGGQVSTSSV